LLFPVFSWNGVSLKCSVMWCALFACARVIFMFSTGGGVGVRWSNVVSVPPVGTFEHLRPSLSLSLSLSLSISLSLSLSQKEFLYMFPATKHTQKVEKNSERETQLHAHVGTNYMPQVTTRTRWPPAPCRLTLRRPAPRRLRTSARGVRRTRTPPSWTRSVRSARRSTGALPRSYPSIAGDLAVELFALTNATRSWISRLSYYG
jgi:hypothetical protein